MHALYLTVLALSFLTVVLAYVPNGWVTRTPRLASQKLFLSEKLSEFQMSIDEIKSELDLRGVDYQDCVSRQELIHKLIESRAKGKANPDILKKFNEEARFDQKGMPPIDDDLINKAKSKDGTLPGGLPPEMVKALTSDPQILQMLRDPKMQDIMQAVMTGGPDAMKRYLADPDSLVLLERLNAAIARASKKA
eukprot:scaffold5444_cov181-Ochromonas_danica.AAC.2